jgi:hypothetical protein
LIKDCLEAERIVFDLITPSFVIKKAFTSFLELFKKK